MRRSRENIVAPPRSRRPRCEGGFALIASLAVLVVLGSTGAMMLRLTGVQQAGASAAILGQRAHWAARAGVEWAMHESVRLGACPAPTTTLTLSEGALSGFSVVVRCTETRHWEGLDVRASLQIQSEASFGALGSRDYVFREVAVAAVL